MAGLREIKISKPIDEAPLSGVSELPGRNGSERESSLVIDYFSGPSLCLEGEGSIFPTQSS